MEKIAQQILEAAIKNEKECTDVGATPFRDKVNEMVCNLELNEKQIEKVKKIIYNGDE